MFMFITRLSHLSYECNCKCKTLDQSVHLISFCIYNISEPPRSSPQQDPGALGNGPPVPPLIDTGNTITYTDEYGNVAADNSTARELPTVSVILCNK